MCCQRRRTSTTLSSRLPLNPFVTHVGFVRVPDAKSEMLFTKRDIGRASGAAGGVTRRVQILRLINRRANPKG